MSGYIKARKVLVILAIVFIAIQLYAQVSLSEMKAAYVEKITLFIDWPEEGFKDKDNFVIGYYQKDEFIEVLQNYLVDISLKQKPVEFLFIVSASDVDRCDLIYIPELFTGKRKAVINGLKGRPILTISNSKGYAEYGVHINFYVEKGKLKFEINSEALKNSNLKASFHLLKLAKIVGAEGGKL